MWKRLKHQNIVPFLGITTKPLQLISEWMPGGVLTDYITRNPNADRRSLVGVRPVVLGRMLTPTARYAMSLAVFTISTLVTSFMVASRECVIGMNPVLPLFLHVSSRISLWMPRTARELQISV